MSTAAQAATERVGGVRGLAGAVRPRVRLLLPPLSARWRPSFVSLCVALMMTCLSALLGINIVLTGGAYTEQQLTMQQTALMEQEQSLSEQVARESAPEVLAQRARDLGMIPNSSPAFIRMSDGQVLGVPTPATVATSPRFSDLSRGELTPEQAAVAAAAANGGVAAVGVDGRLEGRTLPADPGGHDPSDLAGDRDSRTEQAGSIGDGAVPVAGDGARRAGGHG